MATLPTKHAVYRNRVLKYYLRECIPPCVKYFSSKDTSDIKSAKSDLDQNKQNKQSEEKQSDEKLNFSSEAKINEEKKKEAAKKKLFSLLSDLKVSPDQPKIKPDLALAKPLKRISKQERFANVLKKSPDEKIIRAVNAVAESFGGDAVETQTDLKQKLSSLNLISKDSQSDKNSISGDLGISEKLQEELMSSVKDVASTVPTPIRSKLTQRLLRLSVEKKDSKQVKISMENVMKGLKIEKPQDETRKPTTPPLKLKEKKFAPKSRGRSEINIFQAPPLDIFSIEPESKEEHKETVWDRLERKKLKLLTEYAPANAFEEMIMWTEQGKHWKFPIDNETEMGEEETVGFHEHVFLEKHLHGFPTRGPVRHFIELVAVGLSTNPYITVERKIENIDWFRNYFKEKEDILKQCGAVE